jgi:hypothetical protein
VADPRQPADLRDAPAGVGYMAAIRPFRHLIVDPPTIHGIERTWRARR